MPSIDTTQPSAALLREQNERIRIDTSQFTDSQRTALKRLRSFEDTPGLYNVVGTSEPEKRQVVCRLIQESDVWEYHPWLPVKKTHIEHVVVDNVPATRAASRRGREIRGFAGGHSVVLISQEPVPEVDDRIRVE